MGVMILPQLLWLGSIACIVVDAGDNVSMWFYKDCIIILFNNPCTFIVHKTHVRIIYYRCFTHTHATHTQK